MSFVLYKIDHVFPIAQQLVLSGETEPMSLSSFVSDRTELAARLEFCIYGSHNASKCAQNVLDDLAVIYQTYTSSQGSTHMVGTDGNLRVLHYEDEMKDRLIGNVIPLNSDIYLATDRVKETITQFIAPLYSDFASVEELGKSNRERTVKLGAEIGGIGGFTRDTEHLIVGMRNTIGGIGGITRDAGDLIVGMRNTGVIMFYWLNDILYCKYDKPEIHRRELQPKCKNVGGIYTSVNLNEIEFNPADKKLWGVPKKSDKIIAFDRRSGKCLGGLKFENAIKNYLLSITKRQTEINVDLTELKKLNSRTVVNGIHFIAKDWLVVSPWNSSTRFIVKLAITSR